MTRERKSADDRKVEITETAIRLADEVGPDRLTTERIARAVGVTQAAIFRHFPTKQDLWQAVAGRISEEFQRHWAASEQCAGEPLARLRRLIRLQLTLIRATPAIPAIVFSRELHVENALLRRIIWQLMTTFHGRIERLVRDGQANGVLAADVGAADAAFLILGLIQGLVLRWSLSGRDFDLVEEGCRLLDIQLRSFGAPTPEGCPR